MARAKYEFNKKTLTYEKVEERLKDKLKRIGGYTFGILVIIVATINTYPIFIDSPKEAVLKEEINKLQFHVQSMNEEVSFLSERLEEIQKRDDHIYRVIFEAEPLPNYVRTAGIGGVNRYNYIDNFENADLVRYAKSNIDKLAKQLKIQSISFDSLSVWAKNKELMLASIPAIQPISNKDLTRVASGFGMRLHPVHKINKMHTGIDFTAPKGTDIYATGDGKVIKLTRSRRGYGNHIVIDHGYGYTTLYAHLSKFNVRLGQNVKRGDIIGYVGNTGTSTSPHLHYEVAKDRKKIDPVNFFYNDLTAEQYEEMIKISSARNQSFD